MITYFRGRVSQKEFFIMKNTLKFLGCFILVVAVAFSMISCGGDTQPRVTTYSGKASETETYTLVVTEKRAAYSPKNTDPYVLTTTTGKISTGTVTNNASGKLTLQPIVDGMDPSTFVVSVTGNAIEGFDPGYQITWNTAHPPETGPAILVSGNTTPPIASVPGGAVFANSIQVKDANTYIWTNQGQVLVTGSGIDGTYQDNLVLNPIIFTNPVCSITNGKLNINIGAPNLNFTNVQLGDPEGLWKLPVVGSSNVRGWVFYGGFVRQVGSDFFAIYLDKDPDNDIVFLYANGNATLNGKNDQNNYTYNNVSIKTGWNLLLRDWDNMSISNVTVDNTYKWTRYMWDNSPANIVPFNPNIVSNKMVREF